MSSSATLTCSSIANDFWRCRLTWKCAKVGSSGSTLRLTQDKFFNHAITGLQSFGEFLGLIAATFGHVGFAAAFAADDGSEFFDDLSGRDSLCEIVRGAHD